MAWIEEALPHSTETVWNTGLVGTSVANHGDSLTIGREGGWAPEEGALFDANGWRAVSLGPRILRAETAAIAALAVVASMLE